MQKQGNQISFETLKQNTQTAWILMCLKLCLKKR